MHRRLSRRTCGWTLALGAGLGVASALLCMDKAHAHGHGHDKHYTYDVCDTSNETTTVTHVVGTFTETTALRDMLTDWIEIPPHVWNCTRYTDNAAKTINVTEKLYDLISLQADFSFEGENYTIWHGTPETTPKVGFIMRHRYTIKTSDGATVLDRGWQPVHYTRANGTHYNDYKLALPHLSTYTVTLESQVRLLKRIPAITAGNAIEFQVATLHHWRKKDVHPATGLPPLQDGKVPARAIRIRAWFNRDDTSCYTPDSQAVTLPPTPRSAFDAGEGTPAGTVGFNLILNCGASNKITSIKYKLAPAPRHPTGHNPTLHEPPVWASYANGILPNIAATGAATGVGVQILDHHGNAVTFDRTTLLPLTPDSDFATSGIAKIPLQAQYIRTGTPVTAGAVQAVMTVLYMYK